MKFLSFLFFNIVITCSVFAQEKKVFNCPSPSEDDVLTLCNDIYNKVDKTKGGLFSYHWEETLWQLACIEPTPEIFKNPEKLQEAHKKIQAMWFANRNLFFCTGFPLANANVTNFSMNSGFSMFLRAAVKLYKLDMNFKVTEQGSIMDYLADQIESYKRANDIPKVSEFEKIYKVMEIAGTKHGKDL